MPVERSTRRPGQRSRKLSKGAIRRGAEAVATLVAAQTTVGSFLRATRERMSLTQAEVAARTRDSPWQLSRAAVSAIERGQNFPGLEAMLALSNVLQIDPKELIERARLSAVVPVDVSGLAEADLEKRASQYFWAGDYRRALSVYDALVQKLALEERDEPDRTADRIAQLEVRRATTLKRAGALISAIASAERAIVLAAKHTGVQAEAYVVLADLQVQRGHLPLARDAAERAIQLASESASPRILLLGFIVKGRVHYLDRHFDEALAAFLAAHRAAAAAADGRHLTHIAGNVGMCHLELGDPGQARVWIERAVELAKKNGQPALAASWLVELGKLALRDEPVDQAEPLDRAERLARAALEIARPLDHRLTVFRAEWLRHRVAMLRDPGDADRQRVVMLRGLYSILDQHEGIDEINEFKRAILSERVVKGEAR